MCRTHRYYIATTVLLWIATLSLAFTTAPTGPGHKLFILLGCMAVVMVPYCLFPWLVNDMMDAKLKDTTGAFLAGWQAAQEDSEPTEPASVTPLRSVCS